MVTSTVETLSPTRVKLHITVSPDDLKANIARAYELIAGTLQVPGFRHGKVPAPIIDQRVGRGAVIEQAVNDGLDGFFRAAVTEHDVKVLGRPAADVTAWPSEKDFSGDLQVDVEVDVRPEFDLPDLEEVTVTVDAIDIDDSAVDDELDRLRGRFGTLVPVERPAASGDFVELDLVATIDDVEVDRADGVSYEVGSGELLEGIDEAIDSLTAGEETTFRSKLVGGDHAGEEAEVQVTVTAVKERELPDADDDFAQMAGEFDTIDELRASLRETAGDRQAYAQGQQARDRLVEELLERVDIPVAEGVVAEEVERHLAQEERGDDDEHRAEVVAESEKQFRTQLLLDALIDAENIEVSQEEFTNYLIQVSAQYGMAPQEFIQALQENNQLPAVMGDVARNKAIAVALGKVSVVDTTGQAVTLSGFAVADDDSGDADTITADEASAGDDVADAEVVEDPADGAR